jgi:ATP-dependent helicase HrpA
MFFEKIKQIETLLPQSLGSERFQIRKELFRIKRLIRKPAQPDNLQNKLAVIERRLITSIGKKKQRKENVPDFNINKDLPIAAKRDEIVESIRQHQILIISGDTGSGKTTQIPKLCLEAGRGIDGKIGLTQPRRIAATTVARRIAEELNEDLGQSVGYKIRFDEKISRNSFIKIMTDGILLAETQTDPFLNEYDTIIIDEAHERSLNIDFVLGLLKTLIAKRKDLKLIITSATIDTEKFSKAFDGAPIIEVSGRMYPVEVKYWPPEKFSDDEDITHVEMAVAALDRLQQFGPFGDILVFMPTEQDIRETCDLIEGRKYQGVSVFPLFARLSSGEQKRVFSPGSGRKIIVATNVAETSITIPGIRYVVDTGLARMLRYLPRTRTTALPIEPVSRSSADQRLGRCGRMENGICIRLYSEDNYQARPFYTTPEILRSNLAEVILRMIALNLGDIEAFPFIDRPASKSISDGFEVLKELGAISEVKKRKKNIRAKYALTPLGRFMAKIPLDPRISRMLIEAQKEQCISDILVIAAVLSIQDPRERPLEKADEADQMQARFVDPVSDFITLLTIWNCYQQVWQNHKSAGKLKRFCKEYFLSFKRMREWRDIHEQLRSILEESGIDGKSDIKRTGNDFGESAFSPTYEAIHRCILSGFLSNIAQKKEKNIYKAAKDREVMIFPGSGLFNRAGNWIVAAEMIETSRLFARTCAGISSQWLESLGKELCRYTYPAPHWDKKRGEVIALEQVSLFGLVIVENRTVSFGKIKPAEATEIFIRNALVEEEIRENFAFIEHNRNLRKKITDLENRLRRRDILVSHEEIFRFYSRRLGSSYVYSMSTLKKAIKDAGGDDFLKMTLQDSANYLPGSELIELFPDQIRLGKNEFLCQYDFAPGNKQDGMTINIPASMVSSIDSAAMDWHAPGFMEDKIFYLVKGLPKKYRKKLVPVVDTVKVIIEEMPKAEVSLLSTLSRFIFNRFGVDIPASEWSYDNLPDYLKMRFSIVDEKGKTILSGRDREVLSGDYSGQKDSEEIVAAKKAWERNGICKWDFGDIPETITVKGKAGGSWILFPGLKSNESDTVSLCLFSNRDMAVNCHKEGILTLFKLYFSNELKYLKKNFTMANINPEYTALCGGRKIFEKNLFHSVLKDLFLTNIRSREAFFKYAEAVKGKILKAGVDKTALASEILKAVFDTRQVIFSLELSNRQNLRFMDFCSGIRNSLENLVPENFLELYANDRLLHMVRYIQVISIRVQRWLINPEKDNAKAKLLKIFTDKLDGMLEGLTPETSGEKRTAIEEFFWLIEEFKVSLFAQELKTVVSVSEKRLSQKILEIERMV